MDALSPNISMSAMGRAAKYFSGLAGVFLANPVVDVSEPTLHGFDRDSDAVGEPSIGQLPPAYRCLRTSFGIINRSRHASE